jgi:hypothetical protein
VCNGQCLNDGLFSLGFFFFCGLDIDHGHESISPCGQDRTTQHEHAADSQYTGNYAKNHCRLGKDALDGRRNHDSLDARLELAPGPADPRNDSPVDDEERHTLGVAADESDGQARDVVAVLGTANQRFEGRNFGR